MASNENANCINDQKSTLDVISCGCFLLYCVLGVFINSYLAKTSSFRLIINVFRIVVIAAMCADIVENQIRDKIDITLFYMLFAAVGVFCFIFSRNQQIMLLSIFIIWSKGFEFKRLLKLANLGVLIGVGIVIALSLIHVIPNIVVDRTDSSVVRYGLGFIAPTLAPAYLLFVILADAYIYEFKLPVYTLLFEAFASCILFYFTNARLDFICSVAVLAIGFVIDLANFEIPNLHKAKYLFLLFPLIAFAINVLMIVGYQANIGIFVFLANITSGRISYTIEACRTVNVTLFGSDVDWESLNIILDSSYFKMLLEYGIVGLSFVLIYYSLLFQIAIKNEDNVMIMLLVFICIESIFEPFIIDYNYNHIILFGYACLCSERKISAEVQSHEEGMRRCSNL